MAIFTAIGAVVTAVGTFIGAAGAIGTFILNTAVGVGLNLLAKQIAGKPKQTQQAGPGYSVQGKLTSGGDVPRSIIAGWRATAGSLVYANTWGEAGGTPNAYLTQVIALADYPVKGLVGLHVNGEKRTIRWDLETDRGFVVDGFTQDEKRHLWIRFYDGTQTAADPLCVNKVSSAARPYEATRVGVGVPYAVVTSRVNDELFSGFPQYKFVLDGARFYDISKDSTAGGDGPQRWDNPSTWGGDGDYLPAVQAYNLKRGIRYAGQWLYGLQKMTAPRLPAANWIAQIAKCRAAVDGPNGLEPLYRASAEIFVNNEIAGTVEQFMTACQGRIGETGGFYKMHCGAPEAPVMSFTDDDIISTQEQSFTPFFGLSDTINGITAKYPEPDEGWNYKAAPPIYRTDLEAQAGGRRLLSDVTLDLVPYARQVQQLMKEALQEAQRARRHTIVLPPEFWPLEPGDIVAWTSVRNGYVAKWFRVDGVVDRADLDVMVDITEVDPADYNFNLETDYTAPVIGPTIVVRPPAQPIVDFDAVPYTIRDAIGLPRRPGILLSWEVPEEVVDVIGVEFKARLASDPSEIVSNGRTDDFAAGSVAISQNLIPNTNYQVAGRYLPGSPRETAWSTWMPVTTPDNRFSLEDFNAALQHELDQKIGQLRRDQEAANRLLASLIAESDAARGDDKVQNKTEIIKVRQGITAAYRKEILASVGPESALAQAIEEVSAAVGGVEASLKVRFIAGVTPVGALAQYDAIASVENALAGLSIVAYDDGMGGAYGHVHIRGDRFFVTDPSADAVPVVIVDTIENKIYLNGDIILPGSITVEMLSAGIFTAINANITNLTVANINSHYAIYNAFKRLAAPFSRSVTVDGSGSGSPGASERRTGTITDIVYTPQSGLAVVLGSTKFDGGTDPGFVPSPGLTCEVYVRVKDQASNILSSTKIVNVSGSAARPLVLNGQVFAVPPIVIEIPTAENVTVEVYYDVWVGGVGGVGSSTFTWRWTQANLLFLEPQGIL